MMKLTNIKISKVEYITIAPGYIHLYDVSTPLSELIQITSLITGQCVITKKCVFLEEMKKLNCTITKDQIE